MTRAVFSSSHTRRRVTRAAWAEYVDEGDHSRA